MPKTTTEKHSDDTHSINISVYKPDGLSSFWSWFTRKNKIGGLPNAIFNKNYKLKLDEDELNTLKINGIDLQKLQINNKNNHKSNTTKNSIFVIPKNQLGLKKGEFLNDIFVHNFNLIQGESKANSIKSFQEQFTSSSGSISIKTKHSFINNNLKYVHQIKSQKSVVNSISTKRRSKIAVRSNTTAPIRVATNPLNRNVLLKSVPKEILRNNTQKKVFIPIYLGRRKVENKKHNKQIQNNQNKQQFVNDNSRVIPMLLTKIKSMEDQISDIEHTTTKINEAYSKNQMLSKHPIANDPYKHKHRKKSYTNSFSSCKVTTKKEYPQNKITQNTKTKSNSKHLMPVNKLIKSPSKNNEYSLNNCNNTNKVEKNSEGGPNFIFDNPDIFLKHHNFTIPNNISKQNLFMANPDVGCDIILKLFNVLSEKHGSTLTKYSTDTSENQVDKKNPENESDNLSSAETHSIMSKPTFEWKHKSVSQMEKILKNYNENKKCNKLKKSNSIPLACKVLDKSSYKRHRIVNDTVIPDLKTHSINNRLEKEAKCSLLPSKIEGRSNNPFVKKNIDMPTVIQRPSPNVLKEKNNVNEKIYLLTLDQNCKDTRKEAPEIIKQNEMLVETFNFVNIKPKENINCDSSTQEEVSTQSSENSSVQSNVNGEYPIVLTETSEDRSSDQPFIEGRIHDLQTCGSLTEGADDANKFCKIEVNQRTSEFISTPNQFFKQTRISCSNVKKDPKVSITILIGDSLRDEVNLRSNIITNFENLEDVDFNQTKSKKSQSVPNNLHNQGTHSNSFKVKDKLMSQNFNSLEHLNNPAKCFDEPNKAAGDSDGSCLVGNNLPLSKKQHFFDTVNYNSKKKLTDIDTFLLCIPGEYINQEKRKLFDEQLLANMAYKHNLKCNPTSDPLTVNGKNVICNLTQFKRLRESPLTKTNCDKTECNTDIENQWSVLNSINNCKTAVHNRFMNPDITYDVEKLMSTHKVKLSNTSKVLETNSLKAERNLDQTYSGNNCNMTLNNQVFSEYRKRACRYGLTLYQEPVCEGSKEKICLHTDHQAEKGDNIEVQSNDDNVVRTTENKCEDLKSSDNIGSSKCFEAHHGKNGLMESEKSFDTKTAHSTVSVQTEWSLIGITFDHIMSYSHINPSISSKRNAASQTEVMMQQVELGEETKQSFNNYQPCMEVSQLSKLITCEVQPVKISNGKKNLFTIDLKEQNVFSDTVETKLSGIVVTKKNDDYENSMVGTSTNRVEETHVQDQLIYKDFTNSLHNSYKEEENWLVDNDHSIHHCSIPCFPSMPEETITSAIPELNHQNVLPPPMFPRDWPTVSQVNMLDSGVRQMCKTVRKRPPNITAVIDSTKYRTIKPSAFWKGVQNFQADQKQLLEKNKTFSSQSKSKNWKMLVNYNEPNKTTPTSKIELGKKIHHKKDCENQRTSATTLANPNESGRENVTLVNHTKETHFKRLTSQNSSTAASKDFIVNYLYSIEYDEIKKRTTSLLISHQ